MCRPSFETISAIETCADCKRHTHICNKVSVPTPLKKRRPFPVWWEDGAFWYFDFIIWSVRIVELLCSEFLFEGYPVLIAAVVTAVIFCLSRRTPRQLVASNKLWPSASGNLPTHHNWPTFNNIQLCKSCTLNGVVVSTYRLWIDLNSV